MRKDVIRIVMCVHAFKICVCVCACVCTREGKTEMDGVSGTKTKVKCHTCLSQHTCSRWWCLCSDRLTFSHLNRTNTHSYPTRARIAAHTHTHTRVFMQNRTCKCSMQERSQEQQGGFFVVVVVVRWHLGHITDLIRFYFCARAASIKAANVSKINTLKNKLKSFIN